jgi:hypothetical protein
VALALVVGGCDNPTILLDVSRTDTNLQLNVFPCPAAKPTTCQDFSYKVIAVFDPGSSLTHRTVGIYVHDATPALQLDFEQAGGGDTACHSVAVTVGGDTANVVVTLGSPLTFTCDPGRCQAPGGC